MDLNIRFENKKVFISILICGVLGILNLIHVIFRCRNLHICSMIIGFLPFIILVFRNIKFHKRGLASIRVITPMVIFTIITISLVNVFVTSIIDKQGIIRDVNKYHKLLVINNYPHNKEVRHFPEEIPDGADKAKLKEWNNIANGSRGFYLEYIYDKRSDIEEDIKKLGNNLLYSGDYNNISEEITIPSLVSEKMNIKEGNKVKIYIIDSTPTIKITNGYCYGIGINYSTNKILYFEENW